ncbi:MAG: hypothetical protein DRO00_08650 [Thermoproteota archaeon]|nr:MAG: hypothetical protein DRO00_08650 [Candidatus Korarchaeota archaeon]
MENDLRIICKKFADKLGPSFIERIEKRIKEDFEEALERSPKELLIAIFEDIHLRIILPFEMSLQIGTYLSEVYDINDYILALSEKHYLHFGKSQQEIKRFVDSFYRMIEELGLEERFRKQEVRWWKA